MLHSSLRDTQISGEMFVGFSVRDADQDFGLTRRQHARIGFGRRKPCFTIQQTRDDRNRLVGLKRLRQVRCQAFVDAKQGKARVVRS